MKPDAHLVNIARGPMVDEAALLEALTQRRIGGATLDVFDTEPLPAGHPLWDAPNVAITAHMSADAVGWRETLAGQFAANVRRWLAGEPLNNVVDKKLGYVSVGRDDMIASATELVDGYRNKTISPVEATEAALDAIDTYDGRVNAFVLVDATARSRPRRSRRPAGSPGSRSAPATACRPRSRTRCGRAAGRRCAAAN